MEDQVDKLVEKKYQSLHADQRLLIGISGIPGSGKTTLAALVAKRINARSPAAAPIAIFVPMDGFHLTRAQLSAMPDPENAHARRGAAFTFDADAYASLVRRLREPITPTTASVLAPSFDHAVKDPVPDDIAVERTHRVVVLEGNYLSLDRDPWSTAAKMLDELWFVQVDFEVARARLVLRHVQAGIAKDVEDAGRRADENDLVNGREIVDGMLKVDEVVLSREDASWAPKGNVLKNV